MAPPTVHCSDGRTARSIRIDEADCPLSSCRRFQDSVLTLADLSSATLTKARMTDVAAQDANFDNADLSRLQVHSIA